MNLKNIMVSEKSQSQNITFCMIIFKKMASTRESTETQIDQLLLEARGQRDRVSDYKRSGGTTEDDEIFLKLDNGDICTSLLTS